VLFESALAGGHSATARQLGSIAVGQRADFGVLDAQSSALLGVPAEHVLDALVFSSPDARFSQVAVAGQPVAAPALWPQLAQDFSKVMQTLWA